MSAPRVVVLSRQDRAPIEARSQVFTLGAGAKITAAGLLSIAIRWRRYDRPVAAG